MSRMPLSAVMSYFVGLTKIVASSTQSDVLIPLSLAEMGWRIPLSVATFRSLSKGSIAMIKSIGESGSPCLSPLSCFMGFPGVPLRRILEEDEANAMLNQSLHLGPNPNFYRTSRRYAQETESKAFAMSSLMKRALVFFLLNSLMRLCTRTKLL
jgi:hypothetical protein